MIYTEDMTAHTILQQIKLRLILTGLFAAGFAMVFLPIIAGLVIVSMYALLTVTSTYAKNVKRQTDVQQIILAANEYYSKTKQYPGSLAELKKYYQITTFYGDGKESYPYAYDVTENGQNCIVSGIKTDGKLFFVKCR